MKQLVFIISGLILFSCQNEESTHNQKSNEKVMYTDSLPDAEWNGEYMKIKNPDEPEIKRKSHGSEYFNMGNVALKIGEKEITYINFDKSKTVLSFTGKSINAFITNDQNEQIHLYFKKENIPSNYKGKYKADPEGKSNSSFTMSITSNEEGKKQEYTIQTGEAEITKFSPQLATFELTVKGVFINQEGTKQNGKGKIKMNFENAVMTAN